MLGGRGSDNGLAEIMADRKKAAQIPGDNIAGIQQPQRDHGPVAWWGWDTRDTTRLQYKI